MPITVIHEEREHSCERAEARADELWLDAAEVEAATGWQWRPEGLCRGEICVPLPRDTSAGAVVRGDRLDLAAVWRARGQPVVHDSHGGVWVLGTGAAERRAALATLEAPDFELPDLEGRRHRLSSYRGRKVFLATWASW
jgi:hypothetical protein